MISDETFFAWLDGELDPNESSAVEREVALNPALKQKADSHRALLGRLRDAFDPIAEAPLPERVKPRGAEVVDIASHRPTRHWIAYPGRWAAMAATLAIGIMVGSLIQPNQSGPVAREGGQLVASGELEQALATRLASAPAAEGTRIGLTFHDARGDLCRSFTDEGSAGLACHQDGQWRIRGLFQSGGGQQGGYRMAAGPDPRLAELINSTISGGPLDAAGERKALDALR